MLGILFPLSLFVSASLLFSIQPVVAKALLPVYGGTPAVWIVCMLFFQLILLIAYGYVWIISRWFSKGGWRLIHLFLAIISLLFLPSAFYATSANHQPEWGILYGLLSQLGLPLLLVGASAPLLQFAYSQTKYKDATDPYFLYAASNCGSLIALLLYPFVIERFIGINQQFYIWRVGYFIYIGLLALVLLSQTYKPIRLIANHNNVRTSYKKIAYWIFLSFIPCSLMLGVTLYITTDVAATPLFWILPLVLYLLSFIVIFRVKPIISRQWINNNTLFFLVFSFLGFILGISQIHTWQLVLFNLASFFILALLCHGQLFQCRPGPQQLTLFYFCLSLGGVLAGLFNSLIAPHLFNQIYEYPIAIWMALFALPYGLKKQRLWISPLVFSLITLAYVLPEAHWIKGLLTTSQVLSIVSLVLIGLWAKNKKDLLLSLLILLVFTFSPQLHKNHILLQQRNFYGVKQVLDKDGVHVLISQSTVHGLEDMNDSSLPNGITSYYGAIASVLDLAKTHYPSLQVTEIGLGTGTILCQFRRQDKLDIIEIDPQVIALAEDAHIFNYYSKCLPHAAIQQADGRLAIGNLQDKSQDVIIIDAFNSDAVPVHLLTLEAFAVYQQKLKSNGIILVNLSNRHMNLFPVVYAAGKALQWMVLSLHSKGDLRLGQFDSEWALLTANDDYIYPLLAQGQWQFLVQNRPFLWTDDYSNIVPLIESK